MADGYVFNVSSGKINFGKCILILYFKIDSLKRESQENKSRDKG